MRLLLNIIPPAFPYAKRKGKKPQGETREKRGWATPLRQSEVSKTDVDGNKSGPEPHQAFKE